jgi:hypothetical protein
LEIGKDEIVFLAGYSCEEIRRSFYGSAARKIYGSFLIPAAAGLG